MAILKSNMLFGHKNSAETVAPDPSSAVDVEMTADGKTLNAEVVDASIDHLKSHVPHDNVQTGVQKIQAVTLTWSRTSMFSSLCLLWLVTLANGFRTAIFYSLTPYATSDFQNHSLLPTINIVSGAITSALYIPVAKLVDVWGRAEGWIFMVGLSTVGLVMMAASRNIETYCAADVFYSVGFAGMNYILCVLAADVTNLRNRGIAFAFTSSPYMITAFAGSKAAEKFLRNVHWRWGFGAFAIIIPCIASPVYFVLKAGLKKAEQQGIIQLSERSGRTLMQNLKHHFFEFDILGVILLAGGFTVFLLPFTLASTAPNGWKTDYIVGMIVTGFVLIVLFGLYQAYWAPQPFLKHEFLTDRTVIGACLLDATYQMSYYCWNSYFNSFLQVVSNLDVAEAGYVGSTFQVVSGVLLFLVGYIIRRTGYFRWLLFIGVPLYIFAQGLMIHFRQPNQYIGYIVMCEIFISVAGATFILIMQLSVLAAVDHQHVAAALAVLFVSGGIGGSVGNAISGAIWTNTFLPALQRNLPEAALPNITMIYSSLQTQLSYPVNSPERIAIQESYGYAQTRMLAAGTGLMALNFAWVAMIRNYNVKKMTQTSGVVF
ncbi:major facilitator superfamily domain-containing protein [Chaetomium tenue]|uniref:Major facilitator superfamily domain-containing protein n=1 Tax=Chaetomium tenue TaxID=1854479 RepID=A0ACB7P6R1_9PEZI|nr:major facilitator superfamily domain-containing protein [Chaetomium globosum]